MPKYVLKSLLAGIFSVTFTVSPYAYAENKTPVNQVKTHIKDTKLTTTKSYSEMFARISAQNPKVNPLIFKQMAEAMSHEKFPSVQVQEFKYKGKDALKVMVQINKEQVVIEYLFNGDEVMKINGTVFKTADTASSEAFDRKLKSVEAFRKVYQDFQKRAFKAATIPTYAQWQKMTRGQRAEFYLRYRELLEAAYKVHGTGKFKVVSNNEKTFSEFVKASFLGEDAYADNNSAVVGGVAGAAAAGAPARPPGATDVQGKARQEAEAVAKAKRLTDGMGNPDPFQGPGEPKGPSCIVAGYARQWKGTICPWDGGTKKGADQFYKENPVSQECRQSKGEGWIACNPLIYGFDSQGGAHCINSAVKSGPDNFNYATHGSGPCERKSPLNSAEDKMTFIKNILAREKIPGADTLSIGPDPKCKAKTDGSCPNVVITKNPDLFKKIMGELSGPIATYIDSAKKICEENTTSKKWNYKAPNPPHGKSSKPDPAYQDEACDALLKRAIAVQNLLTTEETPPPPETVIASPCDGWTPTDHVQEAPDKKSCVCKDKPKCRLNVAERRCDIIDGGKPEYEGGEPVADLPASPPVKDAPDCGSYFTRMNPTVSECSSTAGDWFKTFLGVVGGICLSNALFDTHITGLCAKRKSSSTTPPVYVDPVAPCPATGCPTTDPVDPVTPVDPEPPRTSETETNQTNPTYNPSQVPPR